MSDSISIHRVTSIRLRGYSPSASNAISLVFEKENGQHVEVTAFVASSSAVVSFDKFVAAMVKANLVTDGYEDWMKMERERADAD